MGKQDPTTDAVKTRASKRLADALARQGSAAKTSRTKKPPRVNQPREGPKMALAAPERRQLIAFYYIHVLAAPDESHWDGSNGTVSTLVKALKLPTGSRAAVRHVLEVVQHKFATGDEAYTDVTTPTTS
ncbi:hypothetical protein SPRG_03268 [Saprolegnia parasitica CBS 223.65]|uniref:Uncharacterized protein n=1 Tax=Saprolegnia parasitica (strain CBS 223.65) TaxID=695850 RepID=A0A067CS23_SAPPC|nr:hypothetical protein SPRG_03268 [Saprolegnia parasitica CBS 223.65]KDO32050.1 hypothetical protein SPRG_03268 [Saprolegnia parasitica CBS 223.65]|eukprot:XP_012197238.1 hypothetical protein SPRG_03268 [Saprolegnia parasitica CBS 223.65]